MMKALITSKLVWVAALYFVINHYGHIFTNQLDAVASAISF